MYFLFKMGIFRCYVCLPEGKWSHFLRYPIPHSMNFSIETCSSNHILPHCFKQLLLLFKLEPETKNMGKWHLASVKPASSLGGLFQNFGSDASNNQAQEVLEIHYAKPGQVHRNHPRDWITLPKVVCDLESVMMVPFSSRLVGYVSSLLLSNKNPRQVHQSSRDTQKTL